MRIKLGSVAFLTTAGIGYGIGLDDNGHLVEFLGDWRALAELEESLHSADPVLVDVVDWQVLAVDDEVRLPLSREAMAERATYVRAALARRGKASP
jgi:hypothetical protein